MVYGNVWYKPFRNFAKYKEDCGYYDMVIYLNIWYVQNHHMKEQNAFCNIFTRQNCVINYHQNVKSKTEKCEVEDMFQKPEQILIFWETHLKNQLFCNEKRKSKIFL